MNKSFCLLLFFVYFILSTITATTAKNHKTLVILVKAKSCKMAASKENETLNYSKKIIFGIIIIKRIIFILYERYNSNVKHTTTQ